MKKKSLNSTDKDHSYQLAFVQNVDNGQTLRAKEILVLESEEILLNHRIGVLKEFIRSLATEDPQYGMIVAAMNMDKVELDHLTVRKLTLLQSLERFKNEN